MRWRAQKILLLRMDFPVTEKPRQLNLPQKRFDELGLGK
jgi:hypothetical protein